MSQNCISSLLECIRVHGGGVGEAEKRGRRRSREAEPSYSPTDLDNREKGALSVRSGRESEIVRVLSSAPPEIRGRGAERKGELRRLAQESVDADAVEADPLYCAAVSSRASAPPAPPVAPLD